MALVAMYPAAGQTVYDEFGALITADGIIATINAYYEPLLIQGKLLRGDPLDTNVRPIYRLTGVSNGQEGVLLIELASVYGQEAGVTITTAGYAVEGDGGSIAVEFRSETAVTVDGVNVYGVFPGRGHWARLPAGEAAQARSTTVDTSGTDNVATTAKATLVAWLTERGKGVDLQPGDVLRLTEPLEIYEGDGISYGTSLRCPGGGGNHVDPAATILIDFDGPVGIRLRTGDFIFENVKFRVATGRAVTSIMTYEFDGASVNTRPQFIRCKWECDENAAVDYGLTIDPTGVANANLEEGRVDECVFANLREAGIWFKGGQPAGWKIYRPHFVNNSGGGSGYSGRGILCTTGACTFSVIEPTWGKLSVGVDLQAPAGVSIQGYGDSENCKRLLQSVALHSSGRPVSIVSGRFANVAYGSAATRPTIAADDNAYIKWGYAAPVTLLGMSCSEGGTDLPLWRVERAPWGTIVAEGNYFPTKNWESVSGSLPLGCRPGGVYQRGNLYKVGNQDIVVFSAQPRPDTYGCRNNDSEVTIVGAAASLVVSLDLPEATDDYVITATLTRKSSTSASTQVANVSGQTAQSFVITLDAAPGGVQTSSVAYTLRPRPPGSLVGVNGQKGGDATTLFGTAAGTGLLGSSSGHWVGFTWYHPTGTTGTPCVANNGSNFVRGWSAFAVTSGSDVVVGCYQSGAGNVSLAQVTLTGAAVSNQCHACIMYYDGTRAQAVADRVVGASGAVNPYTVATGRTLVGNRNDASGDVNTQLPTFGLVGGVGVPSAAEIDAWFLAVSGGDLAPAIAGKTDHRYLTDGSATVNDTVGTANMALVSGTAVSVTAIKPAFSF